MSKEVLEELKKRLLGVTISGHEAIAEFDPDYLKAVIGYYHDCVLDRESNVLPRKTKELIIMSIAAALSRFDGLRIHLKRALLTGATPREVLEALQAAAIPGGLPVMWHGAGILMEELKAMNRKFE